MPAASPTVYLPYTPNGRPRPVKYRLVDVAFAVIGDTIVPDIEPTGDYMKIRRILIPENLLFDFYPPEPYPGPYFVDYFINPL
jgi:hypothetical protein